MFDLLLPPLRLTLWVAGAATLVGVVLGVGLGWLLGRVRFAGRDLIDALILLPLVLPPTVLGYYLLVVIGQRSGAGRLWEWLLGGPLVFTPTAAVLASCLHTVPIVAKSMRAAFAGLPRELEDMARTDGATGWALLRRVYLPQLAAPLTAAGTIAFARAVGDFGVTLMVAGNIPGRTQTASLAIYDLLMAGRDSEALALTLLVSAACVFIVWLSARAGRGYHGPDG